MSDGLLRAGAAALDISPPLGLPMFGFVRRQTGATGYGLPLEASALVLEGDGERVVLCGVDTLGIQAPEVDALRSAIAAATGASLSGVLLSWNHTHCAPPATRAMVRRSALLETDGDDRVDAYEAFLASRIVDVARLAASRLEPAAVAWGVGEVDLSVNRRERDPEGRVVHGWRADGALDRQVVALQARRDDGAVIATLVGYGCHPVAVGMDVRVYSGDYPSALRLAVRRITGGECVFFQGAAGNVLPMVSFGSDEREAIRMGERIALEAVHALADAPAFPRRLARQFDGSLIPMILFRFEEVADAERQIVRCAEESVRFPLQTAPTVEEIHAARTDYERELQAAIASDAGDAKRFGDAYHAKWARVTEQDVRLGRAAEWLAGPVNAVRIGDGAIVSVPGEAFAEIGIAVKERSPGRPTLFAGYTNGAVGYFPTEEAYLEGGYEPVYSNRSYGTASAPAPACERLIVERSVRLAESLFPEGEPFDEAKGWKAVGSLGAPARSRLDRPADGDYAPPPVTRAPG